MRIKRVQQKHKTGCGPACIAMVCGLTYNQAVKLTHPNRKPKTKLFTSTKRLCKVLEKKNINYKILLKRTNLSKIKKTCILAVRHPNDDSSFFPKGWHWIVLSKSRILDPWKKGSYNLKYAQKKHWLIIKLI